jgi:hypothetical protein
MMAQLLALVKLPIKTINNPETSIILIYRSFGSRISRIEPEKKTYFIINNFDNPYLTYKKHFLLICFDIINHVGGTNI